MPANPTAILFKQHDTPIFSFDFGNEYSWPLGKEITSALIREASETLVDEIDPLTDFRGSAEYKSDMSVVFARRALEQVLEPSQWNLNMF